MVWGCAPKQDSVSQSGDLASRVEAKPQFPERHDVLLRQAPSIGA